MKRSFLVTLLLSVAIVPLVDIVHTHTHTYVMVGRLSKLLLILTLLHALSYGRGQLGVELVRRLSPETSPDVQEEAVRQLMQRVVGVQASKSFVVEVNTALHLRSYQVRH